MFYVAQFVARHFIVASEERNERKRSFFSFRPSDLKNKERSDYVFGSTLVWCEDTLKGKYHPALRGMCTIEASTKRVQGSALGLIPFIYSSR